MRSYTNLSDHDFEHLIADVLSAERRYRLQTYARGADKGVDLRRNRRDGTVDIVQCKHMLRSTFSQLQSSARQEAAKLSRLDEKIASYTFVTSQELTRANKLSIINELGQQYLQSEEDVVGANDLEALFNRHEEVERGHPKLWLGGTGQLTGILNASIWNRSRQLLSDIQRNLPLYVETRAFELARRKLADEKVLVISGPPGIGKSTLARMLLADAAKDGYEPIEISRDIEEAHQVATTSARQVFYYDDFLGSNFLEQRLVKNEDQRLASFMNYCLEHRTSLFLLTTREHILQQANVMYEELNRAGLDFRKLILSLDHYSDFDRARILYNHVWHSPHVTSAAKRDLAARYRPIIDHEYYNPRVIEYITGLASYRLTPENNENFSTFAVSVLDNPSQIWKHAFERQLDEPSRDLLIVLATLPGTPDEATAEDAFDTHRSARSEPTPSTAFRDAARTLDDSFLRSTRRDVGIGLGFINPSISDFIADWLAGNEAETRTAIEGASYFDQLEWLSNQVVERFAGRRRQRLREALVAAIQRTWAGPSAIPSGSLQFRGGRLTFKQEDDEFADRILVTLRLMEKAEFYEVALRTWILEKIDSPEQNIFESGPMLGELSEIVKFMRRLHLLRRDHVERANQAFIFHGNSTEDWVSFTSMEAAINDITTPEQHSLAIESAQGWFSNFMESDVQSIMTSQRLLDARQVAEELGLTVDEDSYGSILAEVEEFERREEEEEEERSREFGTRRARGLFERERVDQLFRRLAED